jgi:hypothetical protein
MIDQPTRQKQATPNEILYYFKIAADLVTALRASRAPRLTKAKRVALEDDVVFHFNELIAMEMHTDSAPLRRACAAMIDRHGFDRSRLPDLTGIEL